VLFCTVQFQQCIPDHNIPLTDFDIRLYVQYEVKRCLSKMTSFFEEVPPESHSRYFSSSDTNVLCSFTLWARQMIGPKNLQTVVYKPFCRGMLYKRGLCCHAVSVRLSVTCMYSVKTNKCIFIFFTVGWPHQSSFSTPILRQYSYRDPLRGALNAGKVCDYQSISGSVAW